MRRLTLIRCDGHVGSLASSITLFLPAYRLNLLYRRATMRKSATRTLSRMFAIRTGRSVINMAPIRQKLFEKRRPRVATCERSVGQVSIADTGEGPSECLPVNCEISRRRARTCRRQWKTRSDGHSRLSREPRHQRLSVLASS